jgi:hypothetical protein
MNKTTIMILGLVPLILTITLIRGCVNGNYEYDSRFSYAWDLADKSSTLEAKSNYIDEFVKVIENNKLEFASHNAVWLKTRDNSFEFNLLALKTLQARLEQIKLMNPNSFEYQTAIQQITAQEQGEAGKMLYDIKGCWALENYWFVWNWFFAIGIILIIALWVGWFAIIARS